MKKMSIDQRRNNILEILNRNTTVRVAQFVEELGVSDATVRSDLAAMEQDGLLRRIHGGAVNTKKSYYEMSLHDRMNTNSDEKIRIAKACADLIKDGDTLMINSGTTTRYLAKELSERHNLKVVTNAVQIAQEFVYNNSINAILLGGNLDMQYQFTFGNDSVAQLQKYHANKTIISTDGISLKHGLTTYSHKEIDVTCQMIERSDEVIVVADHTKIKKEGFIFFAPLEKVNVLVTNHSDENKVDLDEIRNSGVTVVEI